MVRTTRALLFLSSLFALFGCTGLPENIKPVDNFNITPYLGKWYEIARLDHPFERGLSNISADYTLQNDGSIQVLNQGWNEEDGAWQQAIGTAKFADSQDKGHLKVSFFGPFYSSYVVYYLEADYSVALVSGYNRDYMWILSRTPTLTPTQLDKYVTIASNAGFDTHALIYPAQQTRQSAPLKQ